MEAVRDFVTVEDRGQDTGPGAAPGGQSGVVDALALLLDVGSTAVADAAFWGFRTASAFAGSVEDLSRIVEYLQLVAASAVERTRKQPAAAATRGNTSWASGWRDTPVDGPDGSVAGGTGTVESSGMEENPADDGYRNAAEFLRARLRISASEARRRLCLAADLLPRQGLTGQHLAPVRAELGAAVATGDVSCRAAGIITVALDRVRHACDAAESARMEHALTRTAAENDPDFLVRITRSWADALDQDGTEPSEELLHQLQGAFIRRPRHGLHHVEIFASADQFEQLLTVMNTAANPRVGATGRAGASGDEDPDAGAAAAGLDRRSRPQMLLDGLVGACKAALASGTLPAAGGLRPQVMVTIDYRDLLARLEEAGSSTAHTGTLMFTGPVTASTVRKIACDADIIPVLLGGEGRILDIGRASRVFPPHIRKALTARDKGCAFPGCTIPASWCEAHHITYWSRGGTSGTDNGTLLCSHHHHLIHKEQWTIQLRTGIPWFIPPPHIDPHQRPRRNHYFRPADLVPASDYLHHRDIMKL